MRKIFVFLLTLLAMTMTTFANTRNDREVILHHGGGNHGFDQISVDPPYVTNGESHPGYTSTTYYSLPAGYYTITIHSIYGYTYTGNFSVS